MKTIKAMLAGLLLAAPLAYGQALEVADTQAQDSVAKVHVERERIAGERAAAQAQFAREEIACRARFAVNDCVARSKARLRELLAHLRQQELVINAAERERQGRVRREDLEQRAAEHAARLEGAAIPAQVPASAPAR